MDMASVPQTAPDEGGAPSPAPPARKPETRVTDLARETQEYARAWLQLAVDEAALAKTNLVRLLVVGLMVPAMATAALVGVDALGAALLQSWLRSWTIATAIVAAVNIAVLLAMGWVLWRWSKTLSLPKSRAALSRLWSPS